MGLHRIMARPETVTLHVESSHASSVSSECSLGAAPSRHPCCPEVDCAGDDGFMHRAGTLATVRT